MVKDSDINKILDILEETYPEAECALKHVNTYQLIVAVVLSAQTTDKAVNLVTPALFEKYRIGNMEALQISVSKLRANGMFETKPVPWIISGVAGE